VKTTAAAARKQAPVVAHNVLAEFTYGGKVAPSFPSWLIDGTRPSRLAWLLRERILPPLYWKGMLKGHEWLAKPELADL
jgi:sulfide:quinone oxidoreductase